MKYYTTLILVLGLASATKLNGDDQQEREFKFFSDDKKGTKGRANELKDKLVSSGVGALADEYLNDNVKANINRNFDTYNFEHLDDDDECETSRVRHNIIDKDADRVSANYESCQVGETYIPALSEKTHVQ